MILFSFGTRPELIKILPIVKHLSRNQFRMLFTGQHSALQDLATELEVEHVLHIKENNSNRLDNIFSSILSQVDDKIFTDINTVVVQGDTASAFAVALAAFHREIDVTHLEAGLRTNKIKSPYPEEAYRQLIARITSLHLCPTIANQDTICSESCHGQIEVVGNTVLDNLVNLEPHYGDHVLVTLHRRDNLDQISTWFREINKVAKKYSDLEFILPLHPNPSIRKHKSILTNVNVVEPLAYDEMKKLLATCRFIITDSGGIQEEASFLRKKVVVCREHTERTETLGLHSMLCPNPLRLEALVDIVSKEYQTNIASPYGDGHSGARIAKLLERYLSE